MSCDVNQSYLSFFLPYNFFAGIPFYIAISFFIAGLILYGNVLPYKKYGRYIKKIFSLLLVLLNGFICFEVIFNNYADSFYLFNKIMGVFYAVKEIDKSILLINIFFILFGLGVIKHEKIQYDMNEMAIINLSLFFIAIFALLCHAIGLINVHSLMNVFNVSYAIFWGMIILSVGLWSFWADAASSRLCRHKKEERGILNRVLIAIVFSSVCCVSIGFFNERKMQEVILYMCVVLLLSFWWLKYSIYPLITTLVESRSKLEDSLKWRSAILESASIAVISTNSQGTISSFNKAAQQMLGYDAIEVVNRQSLVIFHDADELKSYAAELSNEMGNHLTSDFDALSLKPRLGVTSEQEWTYIHKNGNRIPISLAITVLRNYDGLILGFLCVAYDLTERKKMESLKNEFIATVSHELRTPLTSIRGALSLLVSGAIDNIPANATKLLVIANKNCDRLVRLINDFLDLEKIETGNMQFNFSAQSLLPIIEQSIQSMQSFASQFNVVFELILENDVGNVNVDADRISQVIVNLLSNAAKFSDAGRKVDILLSQKDNRVCFSVKNYGKGIPAEYNEKIFSKFVQVSENNKQRDGTGLGLSISKIIIEKHYGRIDFKSEKYGYTEFFFDLPVVVDN